MIKALRHRGIRHTDECGTFWIGIAAMVVGGIASSAASQKAADKSDKKKYADSRDLSELEFQQKTWADQQARAWQLQDYQRTQNYKESAIGSFRDAAPANAASADGSWGAPPPMTDVSSETSKLAPTQANGQPLIYDPRTGQPIGSNFAPMTQFAPPKAG